MQAGPLLSLSPSFNSYSSTGKLAEIAARVVNEFRQENVDNGCCAFDPWETHENSPATQFGKSAFESNPDEQRAAEHHEDEDEDEFEFAFVCRDSSSSPISADDIFCNGQIRPVYPVFDRSLLQQNDVVLEASRDSKAPTATTTPTPTPTRRRQPLRKLMFEEERDSMASCSSSEADELDGLPPETFCVWTPKAAAEASPRGSCKKSNSTGSSKRWKFRQLLRRSNSEGKDMFVFLTPTKKAPQKASSGGDVKVAGKGSALQGVSVAGDGAVAHEAHAHYVKSRASSVGKEDEKKKSLLPLVGLFANVNGLGKSLHPF